MSGNDIKIVGMDVVIRNLENWSKEKVSRVTRASQHVIAPSLENYARSNRPWQDRTGNARRRLHTKVVTSADDLSIQLHHGVSYGVFLELKQAGKFAILKPTIMQNQAAVLKIIKTAWGK